MAKVKQVQRNPKTGKFERIPAKLTLVSWLKAHGESCSVYGLVIGLHLAALAALAHVAA